MKRPRGTADVDNSDDRPGAVAKLEHTLKHHPVDDHKLRSKASSLSFSHAASGSPAAARFPQLSIHHTHAVVANPLRATSCKGPSGALSLLQLLSCQQNLQEPAASCPSAMFSAPATTTARGATGVSSVSSDSEALSSDDLDSPSSTSSDDYLVQPTDIETVDLTLDTDTDDESDVVIIDNVLIFKQRGQLSVYDEQQPSLADELLPACNTAALCACGTDTGMTAVDVSLELAAGTVSDANIGRTGARGDTDSGAEEVSSRDCRDAGEVERNSQTVDSQQCLSCQHSQPQLAGEADTVTGQWTPPSNMATQQQQPQQLETPVLTEQQRIRATADCKSPGTPQLLLLPGVMPVINTDVSAPAAYTSQHQQHIQQQEDIDHAAAGSGRKVLKEMQLGQQRGDLPVSSRRKRKQRSQQLQQEQQSLLLSPTSKAVVRSSNIEGVTTAAAAAAAPGTPEMVKQTHTAVHQAQTMVLQEQEQKQQRQVLTALDEHQHPERQVCSDVHTGVAAAAVSKDAVTLLHSAVATAPVPTYDDDVAAAVAVSSSSSPSDTAEAAVTAKLSVLLSPVASSKTSQNSLQATAAAGEAAVAPPPAAAVAARHAAGHASVVVSHSLSAPPLTDCRTMAYVRAPRQSQTQHGPPLQGRLASQRQAQSAAPHSYCVATAAAYLSGSNDNWSSSSSVSSDTLVPGSSPPAGAGTLSVRPTLEQRVQCAYLRMRLTEAAAAGADWAVLDLAGLPLDTSEQAVEASRQRYAKERAVLLKYRNPGQVSTEDKKMTAALHWIKEVRLAAAAAAQTCAKQGILKRPMPVSDTPVWQISSSSNTVCQQGQGHRVRFSSDVQVSTAAPTPSPETADHQLQSDATPAT